MKKLVCLFVAVFMAIVSSAQNSIQVQTHKVVALNEQFNLTFIIEGEHSPSDFHWECPSDFQLLWGPQQSSQTSVSIINGKRSVSRQVSYTYVLMPTAVGKFTIPAARAEVKGSEIASVPVGIEVISQQGNSSSQQSGMSGSGNSSHSGNSSGSQQEQSSVGGSSEGVPSEDIFMRLTLDKTNVVVGQPITASLKLYQRVNIAGFENANFPSFSGFWSQEVESPTNIEFVRENYEGTIYNTALLRKYVLIPQQSGKLRIDPAELVCLVNVRIPSRSGSIFDSFFDDYSTIRKKVTSKAVTVNVSPLPSGAPSSFAGGVGKFTISAKLDKDSLKAHEANSLIVTVSGRGNVSLLETPKVKFPLDMEVYDTKVTDKSSKNSLQGSKQYEFPFIPRSYGDFVIEPIVYTYYDVENSKYVSLTTPELKFHVEKGSDVASGGNLISAVQQNDVKNLNADIHFIYTKDPSLKPKSQFMVSSSIYWVLILTLIIISMLLWSALRKIALRRADIVGNKNRKATRKALKRLHLAKTFLSQNLYTAFYEELHKALLGFISDKLNIPAGELNKDNISQQLISGSVPQDAVNAYIDLIDACEFARYAPSEGHEAMQAHFDSAVNYITIIDSSMKQKKNSGKAPLAIVLFALMLSATSMNAQTEDFPMQMWEKANTAYSQGNWQQAIDSYLVLDSMGLESAELYYNLGNAYFKNSEIAKSILCYERALIINPSHKDAKFNLKHANNLIQDRIEAVPDFFLKTWAKELSYMLDSNTWAIISIVFFALILAMVLLFVMGSSSLSKKIGFFSAIFFLILFVSSLTFSLQQRALYFNRTEAIVMKPVAAGKSSPSEETGKDLFVLHEGTKVKVIDNVGEWTNVELSDGRQAWLKKDEIERI